MHHAAEWQSSPAQRPNSTMREHSCIKDSHYDRVHSNRDQQTRAKARNEGDHLCARGVQHGRKDDNDLKKGYCLV